MSVHKRAQPKRRRLAKEARREEILEAALAAFVRGGYHGTHVSHVIREAGVARGTFYLYFRSKHEVFAALVDRMLSIFLEARPARANWQVADAAGAAAALKSSYLAVLGTFRKHRRLARLLFEEAVGIDKGFAERLTKHFRVWHERVRDTLTFLQERGVARRGLDADVTAELILGMVERLTRRFLFQDREPDLERLVDALVAFELRGVAARS